MLGSQPIRMKVVDPAPAGAELVAIGPIRSLVPFRSITERLPELQSCRPGDRASVAYEDLLEAFRMLLLCVEVDEAWYCRTYPDVAEALQAGAYRSARQHFLAHGYFEGRRPRELPVDETWYRRNYPDVAARIDEGDWDSGTDHFNQHGYAEGRSPVPL